MSWPKFWSQKTWQTVLLSPLSKLVCWEASRRYKKFKNIKSQTSKRQTAATVVVVGNVVVGGTGKTPFIIWLSSELKKLGYTVGVISRGYGAKESHFPLMVNSDTPVTHCGDEPYMLHKQTGCPVAVSPKRDEALTLLTQHCNCDFVISDDGLQHYALERDIEIVLIDAERQFGNGLCMPAGPLREPITRIADVDFTVWNGLSNQQQFPNLAVNQVCAQGMQLKPISFCQLGGEKMQLSVAEFFNRYPQERVHAIAGIGNPQRFFNTLEQEGLEVQAKAFSDHYAYSKQDLTSLVQAETEFQTKPLVMTQKDAVKCEQFSESQVHWWYLQVEPSCDSIIVEQIIAKHTQRLSQSKSLENRD